MLFAAFLSQFWYACPGSAQRRKFVNAVWQCTFAIAPLTLESRGDMTGGCRRGLHPQGSPQRIPSRMTPSSVFLFAEAAALILIRHGESLWNSKNLFTGCVDVPLSQKGVEEALEAGKRICDIPVDLIFTSALIRAQMTAMLAMTQHRKQKVSTRKPQTQLISVQERGTEL